MAHLHIVSIIYRLQCGMLFLFYFWQRKVKRRALSNCTFGPDSSAMARYDPLHICKPYSCTFKLLLSMQSLEYSEESIRIFHVKPNAIVRDEEGVFVVLVFASDFDFCLRTRTGELDCI